MTRFRNTGDHKQERHRAFFVRNSIVFYFSELKYKPLMHKWYWKIVRKISLAVVQITMLAPFNCWNSSNRHQKSQTVDKIATNSWWNSWIRMVANHFFAIIFDLFSSWIEHHSICKFLKLKLTNTNPQQQIFASCIFWNFLLSFFCNNYSNVIFVLFFLR